MSDQDIQHWISTSRYSEDDFDDSNVLAAPSNKPWEGFMEMALANLMSSSTKNRISFLKQRISVVSQQPGRRVSVRSQILNN
ncbi:uncharacterized protein EI90DRAFT_837691 [Cantharellus anzutake]|uniref:uncharacterized protein n=1 Tax=Cantharellus anzutake TaxID=1750568 RepID=UPI00190415ED|nr:uncharacterized protein EI90DRAFT_837691 [Cantharellus anzutake]KAF8343177.1 hypothetical protein EI90DRAFT_837691 [Cantharellus anzutake]